MSMLLELVSKGAADPKAIVAAVTIATLIAADLVFAVYQWTGNAG